MIIANFFVCCVCIIKKCPKLKSRYRRCVEVTTGYGKMINDFDDLVDPRTFARHCLGLKPSAYVLRVIEIEEKSKCSFASLLTWALFILYIYIYIYYKVFFFRRDDNEI